MMARISASHPFAHPDGGENANDVLEVDGPDVGVGAYDGVSW